MSTEKTDRVSAKFGGRDGLTFVIPRDAIPNFELIIGEPAQARLRRIAAGHATVKEIRQVVEYAAPKGMGKTIPENAFDIEMLRTLDQVRGPASTFVGETFEQNPPLKYAVLAQGILAAALYGIPTGAAHFDEDEEDADDAA